jgi:hypothetical protein
MGLKCYLHAKTHGGSRRKSAKAKAHASSGYHHLVRYSMDAKLI